MLDVSLIILSSSVFAFMFTQIWGEAGEIFGFLRKWHYLYIGKENAIGYFIYKLITCAKCNAVWVSAILFYAPMIYTYFILIVSLSSFVANELTKRNEKENIKPVERMGTSANGLPHEERNINDRAKSFLSQLDRGDSQRV